MSGHELPTFEFKFLEPLKRRFLFQVFCAYLGTAWLVLHIATVIGETFEPVHHYMRPLAYILAGGLPVVLIVSWLRERNAHGQASGSATSLHTRLRTLDIAMMTVIALAVIALGADRWIFHRPTEQSMLVLLGVMFVVLVVDRIFNRGAEQRAASPIIVSPAEVATGISRVAILPFADMSAEKDQDYFCEGTAEEIINALCGVSGLRVASRSASFQLKNRTMSSQEVGQLLNVESFLEGSVRKSGNRLRITTQLINAADGFHLWSHTFDRTIEDIFAIQEEIARHIVSALRVRLLDSDNSRIKRHGTRNTEAYDFYLRGRQLLNKEKEAEQRAAVELFKHAITLDPAFANAYAGLADVLARLMRQRLVVPGITFQNAVSASDRAIELAPDLPDAYVARGNALQLVPDLQNAERAFERALVLDARHFHAHYWFAKFYAGRGHHEQAAQHYEAAFDIQPDDYRPITLALQEYQALKNVEKVRSALRRSWQVLERRMALDPDDSYAADHAAGVLMLLGRREEANRLLERAIALRPDDYNTLYTAACTVALGGEYERALDFLDRAVGTGRGHRDWILNDNDLAPLHAFPKFKEIIAKLT
jgi:TolB-like protein/Tfp pilus assembly protein PilF